MNVFSADMLERHHNGTPLEILYRNMDAALNQEKTSGRNQIAVASNLW